MPKGGTHHPLPDFEYLHECLIYSPRTGKFKWKSRPRCHFGSDIGFWIFNARFANTEAGGVRRMSETKAYYVIRLDYFTYAAHRLAWMLHYGEDPGDFEIDHKDSNKLNNRITNLRLATDCENAWNRKISSANTSGYKGVTQVVSGKFIGGVTYRGKRMHLGTFETAEQANAAVEVKRAELHKQFKRNS